MKINVVGTSGSGKSTLARQLAERLDVPYIEMDRLYWRPEWQGTPDDAFWRGLSRRWPKRAKAGCWTATTAARSRSSGARSTISCGWTTVSGARCGKPYAARADARPANVSCGRAPATGKVFAVLSSAASRSYCGRSAPTPKIGENTAEMAGAGRCFIRLRSPRQAADFYGRCRRVTAAGGDGSSPPLS